MALGFRSRALYAQTRVYGCNHLIVYSGLWGHNHDSGFGHLKFTQTPKRIQKVDPIMGVPIKYP